MLGELRIFGEDSKLDRLLGNMVTVISLQRQMSLCLAALSDMRVVHGFACIHQVWKGTEVYL